MFTNVIFATTAKRINDNDFANMKNFNAANCAENGLDVIWSSLMPDFKRARRGIFDVCRLLRGDIKTGKTFATVPETISNTVGNVERGALYFDGNEHNSTGVMEIDLGGKYAYMWRSLVATANDNLIIDKSIQTATAEQITAANTALLTAATETDKTDTDKTETTAKPANKTTRKPTAKPANVATEYKCKNTAANRSILTNAAILYTETENHDILTYTTDTKTAKTLKIKTVK